MRIRFDAGAYVFGIHWSVDFVPTLTLCRREPFKLALMVGWLLWFVEIEVEWGQK